MQHRSEPDVYPIGKDLQRQYHLTLSEEAINHHRDRALFTIGTPTATRLYHALNALPPEDEYHLLAYSHLL